MDECGRFNPLLEEKNGLIFQGILHALAQYKIPELLWIKQIDFCIFTLMDRRKFIKSRRINRCRTHPYFFPSIYRSYQTSGTQARRFHRGHCALWGLKKNRL